MQNTPFWPMDAEDKTDRPGLVPSGRGNGPWTHRCRFGGGVVKKRVALAGRGKRGGARTLVATNKGSRWFFIFGFEKNVRANISDKELEALRSIAADPLARTMRQLEEACEDSSLEEICHDDQS